MGDVEEEELSAFLLRIWGFAGKLGKIARERAPMRFSRPGFKLVLLLPECFMQDVSFSFVSGFSGKV